MRAALVAATALLAGILLWIFARPAAPPAEPAGAEPAVPVAVPELLPSATPSDLSRVTLPTAEERQRAALESMPHGSVRVVVEGLVGLIAVPCVVELEMWLPSGQRASGKRSVDERGECWFELVPAGSCELTLRTTPSRGNSKTLSTRFINIPHGATLTHFVELDDEIVIVELQCVNPPAAGLESVELSQGRETLAAWDRDDPDASSLPGPLHAWAVKDDVLTATYRTLDDEHVETRQFEAVGRQLWQVELPRGELIARLPPSGGLDKFILQSDPALQGGPYFSTCFSEAGSGTFTWLQPGRYHLRAGSMVRGRFHERARSFVEVGSGPLEVTLTPAPTGTLRYTLPPADPPREPRPARGGIRRGDLTQAALHPVGADWPVFANRACSQPEDRIFEGILAGEYELLITDGDWASLTPVVIPADGEAVVQARDWVRMTHVEIRIVSGPEGRQALSASFTGADGRAQILQPENWDFAAREPARMFRVRATPGLARLVVSCDDGTRAEFALVIASTEPDRHTVNLQE